MTLEAQVAELKAKLARKHANGNLDMAMVEQMIEEMTVQVNLGNTTDAVQATLRAYQWAALWLV